MDQQNVANLGAAITAIACDVADEYILDKDYDSLGPAARFNPE